MQTIKGVGPKTSGALKSLGIYTKEDVLNIFPKRYTSYFLDDDMHIKKGTLIYPPILSRHKVLKVTFKLQIEDHIISCVAYQQPFLKHILVQGEKYLVRGKFDTHKKIFVVAQLKPIKYENKLISVYDLSEVKDHRIHQMIQSILSEPIEDTVPVYLRDQLNLVNRFQAYQWIHFPKNEKDIDKALNYFKVEEAWHLFKGIMPVKKRQHLKLTQLNQLEQYIYKLPFELTEDQEKIVHHIVSDAQKIYPLKHLIQGDVGSGKTIVALLVAVYFMKQGYQVALMVPTEILAIQHVETIQTLFPKIRSVLLTSSVEHKHTIIDYIQNGHVNCVIGTHILASKDVKFHKLGLVIIDEQQKFGVDIRKNIIQKALDQDVMYLTATPIPRTLLRSILGDTTIETIQTLPKGKQPVKTISVSYDSLPGIISQIKQALTHGQHIYVVVPAIDSDHVTYNILNTYHFIKSHFNEDLYVLHGQMPKHEQKKIVETFKKSSKGVLLSTQMIEVGIDIKTATFMVVLEAEYFGLSQLHQLRGRLGRGYLKGICYVVSKKPDDERFELLEKTSNGFEISEHDLYLRGPGDLLGKVQSGLPPTKFLDFIEDAQLIQKTHKIYKSIK
ncbi:MAG TPA: hypothetical protein DC003_03180 [Acholeplasmataceae bacterium]|nr:hypothetical protein [Acholeplasmataceae bacterium]